MNAMKKKMPDKLFGWTGVLGSLYASPRKPEEVNAEEYIRKDALLEWAKDELKLSKDVECVSEKSYEEGRQQVALNLIDKLNQM